MDRTIRQQNMTGHNNQTTEHDRQNNQSTEHDRTEQSKIVILFTVSHNFQLPIAHKAKQKETAPNTGKIDLVGMHFNLPNHDVNDIQISVLAFITLTPLSKDAVA